MRLAALLLVVMAVGAGALTVTHAQPPAGAPRVCAPTNSEKATVAAIAADPASWMGRCVSVEAIYSGERLNVDADAIYGVNSNSIGGYVDGKGDVGGAWTGTFTGRVADCAVAEEDLLTGLLRSPGISLHGRTLGCLEPKGPFLVFMTHSGMKPAGLKRRLPGERGGDLAVVPADWPHRDAIRDRTVEIMAAMEAGSLPDLKRLLGNAYQAERIAAGDIAVFSRRSAQPSVATRSWIAMFVDKDVTGDRMAAESCWSAEEKTRWPIDSRDADNQPSRPYACLRFEGWREGGTWRYRVDASEDVYGLDEP
jgi:hypothetical protein